MPRAIPHSVSFTASLTLDPARSVAIDQIHDLFHAGPVEIKLDRMLQTARTRGKLDSFPAIKIIQAGIDQAGGKRISALTVPTTAAEASTIRVSSWAVP